MRLKHPEKKLLPYILVHLLLLQVFYIPSTDAILNFGIGYALGFGQGFLKAHFHQKYLYHKYTKPWLYQKFVEPIHLGLKSKIYGLKWEIGQTHENIVRSKERITDNIIRVIDSIKGTNPPPKEEEEEGQLEWMPMPDDMVQLMNQLQEPQMEEIPQDQGHVQGPTSYKAMMPTSYDVDYETYKNMQKDSEGYSNGGYTAINGQDQVIYTDTFAPPPRTPPRSPYTTSYMSYIPHPSLSPPRRRSKNHFFY